MISPDFGTIVEEASITEDNPPEFGEIVEEKKTFAPGTALLKGGIKGVRGLSRTKDILSPVIQAFGGKDVQKSMEDKLIEKYFPTGQSALEQGAERVGELLPYGAAGGTAGVIKSILAGASGQALKEAGAPQWAQDLAELAIFMSPKGGKKIEPKPSQKEGVEFLRKRGLSEKAIAPLIRQEKSLRRIGKFAHKGDRLISRLEEAHENLKSGYQDIKKAGQFLELPRNKVVDFEKKLTEKFDFLTPDQQKLVKENVDTLLNKEINAKNLIDFWQDVNAKSGTLRGAKQAVQSLKEPIREALKDIDPSLQKEYELLNQFWARKNQITKTLKPDQLDRAIELAEAAGIAKGVLTGDAKLLTKLLGVVGGRALLGEMLVNPRLQNLSNQMLKEASRNRPSILKKLNERFIVEVKKEYPEYGEILEKHSSESQK